MADVIEPQCDSCEVKFLDSVRRSRTDIVLFMVNHGVMSRESACTRCGNLCPLVVDDLTFRCRRRLSINKKRKRQCSFNVSARAGTFLENSHLSVEQIFVFVSIFLHLKPPRQAFIRRELGIASATIVDWYSFTREVYVNHMVDRSERIGGPQAVVQIDEAKFGRRKYNRGRIIEGQWVFGGIDVNTKRTFLVPVESRDSATLLALIREWILPGTTIISDCWRAYDCLGQEGFRHLQVNHSVNFVDPETGAHTNNIERVWREVRATIPRYGIRKKHFVGYLAEFQFKQRYSPLERIHHFFKAAGQLYPPQR
ncbi:uncharacterized protein LOC128995988 [Macrosteles quadrilineatus]|uniref:uncharacterized protein LOC128991132 n=1 Tax=Macrosteles quadrilineatus TaxID=74068 RepID=UPI0023E17C8B|nr:uncharacterized protein LOC128991132 [Macrosteles quadrilineatus]XP_054277065.1 uncharacterized protein LOC128995988 [Macrosteles quadrilineatus]